MHPCPIVYTQSRGGQDFEHALSLFVFLLYPLYISYPLYLYPLPPQAVSAKGGGLDSRHPKHRLELLSPDCISSNRSIVYSVVDLRPISRSRVSSGSWSPSSNASANYSPTSPVVIASVRRSIVGAGPGLEAPD